jgi:hypothetical protein
MAVVSQPKTFAFEGTLPPLPVPSLEESFARYLRSLEPLFQTDDERVNTHKLVADFLASPQSTRLQSALLKRRDDMLLQNKSWLEDWWFKYAYLGMYCSASQPLLVALLLIGFGFGSISMATTASGSDQRRYSIGRIAMGWSDRSSWSATDASSCTSHHVGARFQGEDRSCMYRKPGAYIS